MGTDPVRRGDMEQNMIPFIYADNEVRTLLDEDGEPGFVAKPFRRWVTHDVLPSIRKYGSYEAKETASEVVTRPQLAKVAFRVKQVAVMAKAFGFKGARRKLLRLRCGFVREFPTWKNQNSWMYF